MKYFRNMLLFLAAALFSLHLSCGENISLGPKGVKDRHFTLGDGEYEISMLRTDWYTARNLCKIQGGQLLSIEALTENIAIMHAICEYTTESFWTSGSDIGKEGLFYWDSTGAPFRNFTFWGHGKPVANNTDHCVELNSTIHHLWADANCDLEKLFICEFHPCSDKLERQNDEAKAVQPLMLRFTFGDGTYEIVKERVTWVDAKNSCKLKGMELVSIETFEEHHAIMDALLVSNSSHFWTSGTTMGHLDNYYWEGTGHVVAPYTGWYHGQPNDPSHVNCILLEYTYGYMWSDITCTNTFNYICELQPCLK